MSKRELRRVEVLARVRSKHLRIVDASKLLQVSYRQAKRLWKRYREGGAAGLKHRSVGRPSNHAHETKFRKKVLQLVGEKYGGPVGERWSDFGSRAFVFRGRTEGECRNATTVDAGGRAMEPTAEGAEAPATAGAQR